MNYTITMLSTELKGIDFTNRKNLIIEKRKNVFYQAQTCDYCTVITLSIVSTIKNTY